MERIITVSIIPANESRSAGGAGRGAHASGIQRVHAGGAPTQPPACLKGVLALNPHLYQFIITVLLSLVVLCLTSCEFLMVCVQDGCGNKLDSEVERLKDVSVEVVSGPTDDGSAPEIIQDLQASFQVLDCTPVQLTQMCMFA